MRNWKSGIFLCLAMHRDRGIISKTDQVREGDLLQIYVTDGQIETHVADTVKLEGERGQSSHKQ